MKKRYFLVILLFVISVSIIQAQTNQTLTAGQVFTANLAPGAVHTYRIQLGTDLVYFIEIEDMDNNSSLVDVIVSVRHSEDAWFRGRINERDTNRIRLSNIKTGSGGDLSFFPNSWYVIEVKGIDNTSRGTYRIAFY